MTDSSERNAPDDPPLAAWPVVVIDDHAIWRGGLRITLEGSRFPVVGEAETAAEALDVVYRLEPRIVLLDLRLKDESGMDVLAALKAARPALAVIMLTTYENPTQTARALAAGANGYLLKGLSRQELINALTVIAGGRVLLDRNTALTALPRVRSALAISPELLSPLTRREEEVLTLLATGIRNAQIAAILSISEPTVKTHIQHIFDKLDVRDRAQAALWVTRQIAAADLA